MEGVVSLAVEGLHCGKSNAANMLQGLPTELRLEIYACLFRDTKIVLTGGFVGVARKRAKPKDRRWQLLLTCRAVHAEALPVYWSTSRLRAYMSTSALMATLPAAARAHIGHVSCRRSGLAGPWEERLPELRGVFPRLRTVMVEESGVRLDADAWRALDQDTAVASLLPAAAAAAAKSDGVDDTTSSDQSTQQQQQKSLLCLRTAKWPRNRVLFRKVTVHPNPRSIIPYVGSYPGYCPTKVFYFNLANGKTALVVDSDKAQGLRSVLD